MSIFHLGRKNNSDALPGGISEIAAVRGVSTGQIITAVRTASKNLQLMTWRVSPLGIAKTGDSANQAGEGSGFDIARGSRVVTAGRTRDGDLKLISWDVRSDGSITRVGDSGTKAGIASAIKIVAISGTLFVTACRAGNGRLLLISWRLNPNGSFTRLADSGKGGDPISEVSLLKLQTAAGTVHRVTTSICDSGGNLKVILWHLSSTGVFTRVGQSGVLATQASSVRSGVDPLGRPVVSVWNGIFASLIVCGITSSGAVEVLSGSGTSADAIPINSLSTLPDGIVSAGRTPSGALRLIAWSTDADGKIERRSDSADQEGESSLINLIPLVGVKGITMVTAAQTNSGTLKLVGWGQAVVRLHTKVLRAPNVGLDRMVANMTEVFGSIGIRVQHVSTETLDLDDTFLDIDVDSCRRGTTTAEQQALFENRNNAGENDVVVYFVRGTDPITGGCATFPPGRPGAVVASIANEWTLAHEVGHVLDLGHVDDNDRLMTGNGTFNITNPPPDLIASEVSTMQSSPLTV